jgi:hypothetical protein
MAKVIFCLKENPLANGLGWGKLFFFFLVVLGFELKAFILSHSTSPFL